MANIECLTELECITCPLKVLKFTDKFRAKKLMERVMDGDKLNTQSTLEDVVREVKDTADIAEEGDELAGIVVGAIAYRLTDRCPQFSYKNEAEV